MASTSAHVPSGRQNPPLEEAAHADNILMVGNPGVGKSTLLNCIIGEALFKSGKSWGTGLTYELQAELRDGIKYMDTPGLSDRKKRQQAAVAITEALKKGGRYKVFFVCRLQEGRVMDNDATTIQLVLDAAKELTSFGIIFNQLHPDDKQELMESRGQLGPDSPWCQVMESLCTFSADQLPGLHTYFNEHDPELDRQADKVKALPRELHDFIARLPPVEVNPAMVQDVQADRFEQIRAQFQEQLATLEERRRSDLAAAEARRHQELAAAEARADQRRQQDLAAAESRRKDDWSRADQLRQQEAASAEARRREEQTRAEQQRQQELSAAEKRHQEAMAAADTRHRQESEAQRAQSAAEMQAIKQRVNQLEWGRMFPKAKPPGDECKLQ